MPRAILLLICLYAMLPTTSAQAWGSYGHQIICEMAFQELTPNAKKKVLFLLKKDPEFGLFSKSCTWPDNPHIRATEHYVHVKRNTAKITSDPCPVARICLITAILNDAKALAASGDAQNQLRLLKSIGHWIGDVHQPLHVSFEDDKRGIFIGVSAPCYSDLHVAWDNCIIEKSLRKKAKEAATILRSKISDKNRQAWTKGAFNMPTVIGWANESFKIATQPGVQYCVMKNKVCQYSDESVEFNGNTLLKLPNAVSLLRRVKRKFDLQVSVTPKKVVTDSAYIQKHASTAQLRLQMAAIRLAYVLNQIWP